MKPPRTKVDSQSQRGYHTFMSDENDHELINFIASTVEALRVRVDAINDQMATKLDLANLRDEMTTIREQMATKDDLARVEASLREDMATKDELAAVRLEMATKNDLSRVETTMRGEFEQVHMRLNSLDRRVDTRVGQIETDVSRLRSVVYLLVKDKPDMLRLLGQTTPRENPPQG